MEEFLESHQSECHYSQGLLIILTRNIAPEQFYVNSHNFGICHGFCVPELFHSVVFLASLFFVYFLSCHQAIEDVNKPSKILKFQWSKNIA